MSQPAQQITEQQGPKVGIFDDVTNEEYHRGIGISKSGLDLIDRSPLHFIDSKHHPRQSTPAMELGTAFHTIILEPDVFERDYVKDPFPGSTAKAAREAREELKAKGKTVIHTARDACYHGKDDWRTLHRMRDAVFAHPLASVLLDHGQGKAEQSVYWVDYSTRKLCKCRPDFINDAHNIAIDLKSTEDASFSEFAKSCAKFRYHVQDPFYRDGLREAGRPVSAFVFIAVEKRPPYGVGIYVLDDEAIRIGRIQYQNNLETYADCHKADEWPSYPEEVRTLSLPTWGLRGHIS
ncbi:MAG: PD-(D/E)XK nuclease-like domain-containing protein [Candidatus Sedimenticola sp. (ex Thyasira tokunagai)]